LKNDLARLNVHGAADVHQFYLLDKSGLEAIASTGTLPANSDFFPVLQLEAPKARFMSITDKDMQALQLAPWPLLEATAGYVPMSVSSDLGLVATTAWRDAR